MTETTDEVKPVGLLRVLAAQLYDTLLLGALLIIATGLAIGVLVMLTGSEHVIGHNPLAEHPWWYRFYLLVIVVVFFVGFWSHGGQTLGMRAWHIRICRRDGQPPHTTQALLRLLAATLSWLVLGLGYLWMLVDSQGLSWHDRLTNTRMEHHRRR